MDIARSALRTGTTTALAWMFVSIGVATGLGVGVEASGVALGLGGFVWSGLAVRNSVDVGDGLGPPSRPPYTTNQPPMSTTTATIAATEMARLIICERPFRPYPS
jgi:hypothetical protein